MLVNITQDFFVEDRRWKVGDNPDVPKEVALRWIAEGKATADTDGRRNDGSAVPGDGVSLINGSEVVVFGDSISANPNSGNRYTFRAQARGDLWHDWLSYLSYQRVRHVGNYAVGAMNLQHVRDFQIPNMLTKLERMPSQAICAFGTNNLADPIDTSFGYAMQIYGRLQALGIRPILCLIPPNTGYTAGQMAWNARVREHAAATGLPLLDRVTPVCVPGDESQWAAGMSDDGTHPNVAGHRAMGAALAADPVVLGYFEATYPDLDRTTGISGASTDAQNLAGSIWNAWTNWDVSTFAGIEGQRFWLDRSMPIPSGAVTVESATFQSTGSARSVSATFAATTDVEFSMWMHLTAGSFCGVFMQPLDAADTALAAELNMAHTWNSGSSARHGIVYGLCKAPAGTAKWRLRMNIFSTVYVGAITARPFVRL